MPPLGSIERKDLIRFLKQLGFGGPFSGKHHQFMIKGTIRLSIPNPHRSDISKGLLAAILKEAGIKGVPIPSIDQIEEALDVIRNMHEYFWLKKGVTPDYEKDEYKLANLVDFNQSGIWLWLRHYLLDDLEAKQLANRPPYDIFKEEAELHVSWYRLAQQAVISDYFPTVVHSPCEELKNPLAWLVGAASDYFEKKMHGSGLLRPLGIPAKPVGKVKRYNWALSISNIIENSTREDLIHERTEVDMFKGLYQLVSVLEFSDDSSSNEDYLHEAMQTFNRFFRQQRDGKFKIAFLDEQKNLVYLDRGKDTRGFIPTKQQKRPRQKH